MIAWRMSKSVEENLNSMLSQGGEQVDLSKSNDNFWNATLLSQPIFQPDYISFVVDGLFHSGNNLKRDTEQTQPEFA